MSQLLAKLEKESKRTQIQMDEQAERILKLSKEVEAAHEESRNTRQKAMEEKKKLLDEKDELSEKLQISGIFLSFTDWVVIGV